MSILVTDKLSNWTKAAAVLLLFSLGMLPWAARAEALLCESFERAGVDANIITSMLGAADGGHLYQIDRDTSRVEFHVDYSSTRRIHGSFTTFEGGFALSPETSRLNQALLLIRVGSLTTGNTVFDAIANGSEFFDTKHFPEMLFVSHGIRWTSATTAKLFGDLTLLGKTRAVVFDISVSPVSSANWRRSRKLVVTANGMIKRSNFGIDGYSGLVGDTVHLSIEFEVLRVIT